MPPEPPGLNRTSVGLKCWFSWPGLLPGCCLNRTSVGLKFRLAKRYIGWVTAPQSNQRGIERWRAIAAGKKPLRTPQSNQRGIERRCDQPATDQSYIASIEPAWD